MTLPIGARAEGDVVVIHIGESTVRLSSDDAWQVRGQIIQACHKARKCATHRSRYYGKTLRLSLAQAATIAEVLNFTIVFRAESLDLLAQGVVPSWRDHIDHALRLDCPEVSNALEIEGVLGYLKTLPTHPILATWANGDWALGAQP